MAKGQKRVKKDLGSLIPEIKNEEKHLDDLLGGARAEADHIREDAQAEADSRIRAAGAALPRVVAAERESRAAEMQREAAARTRAEEEKTRAQESTAAAAMDEAVAYVVSLVWPEKHA
jgi:vacuolar-type H+-ATPase subunit H